MAGAWDRFDLLIRTRWPRLKKLIVVGYSRYPPQMDWYRLDYFQRRLPEVLPSLPSGALETSIEYAFEAWR
ncbi:hypothetical protein FA13DRAFT_1735326 [Coprinellus micaceus]|uniref:Uncharacterized protein n=1 Tax=Coprinellus micaceus TaxID=71717 RepID=A0A4Y7T3V5_COPMI|nr:hypothetical protein FA13DRAFT_1735326 [Coprinellus micaceus]